MIQWMQSAEDALQKPYLYFIIKEILTGNALLHYEYRLRKKAEHGFAQGRKSESGRMAAMKKHTLDKMMNRLSLLLLLGTAAFLVICWRRIPEEIPMHFNAIGKIDRWGSKAELLILPVIAWLMYGLLTAVEHIPRIWNTGVRVTEENRERVYAVLGHLLSTQKLLIMVTFAWITLWCTLSKLCRGNSYSEVIAGNPVVQGITCKNFGIT